MGRHLVVARVLCRLAVILIAALVMRLVLAAALVRANPTFANEPSHIAAHLARGEGFSAPYDGVPVAPTAQQPPLYPLLLALVFKVAGVGSASSIAVLAGINSLLGCLLCWLILRAGSRWLSPATGVLAAWAWALWPTIAATDLFVSNYALSAAFVLAWLLLIPKDPREATSSTAAKMGAAAGIGALLNPMLVLLGVASWPWFRRRNPFLLALGCFLLVVLPWGARNYATMGRVYPALRDNMPLELYIGNHPGVTELRVGPCPWHLCDGIYEYDSAFPTGNERFAQLGEAAYMETLRDQAVSYIRSAPGQFLLRSLKRALAFWLLPSLLLNFLVTICALLGLVLMRDPLRQLMAVMLALYPLAFYVTQVAWPTSYRHPIEPLLLLSAASLVTRPFLRLQPSPAD